MRRVHVLGYYPPGGNREGAIRLYKHGITRHYLNLHPSGQAYRYDGVTGGYRTLGLDEAIAAAFEGLDALVGPARRPTTRSTGAGATPGWPRPAAPSSRPSSSEEADMSNRTLATIEVRAP